MVAFDGFRRKTTRASAALYITRIPDIDCRGWYLLVCYYLRCTLAMIKSLGILSSGVVIFTFSSSWIFLRMSGFKMQYNVLPLIVLNELTKGCSLVVPGENQIHRLLLKIP